MFGRSLLRSGWFLELDDHPPRSPIRFSSLSPNGQSNQAQFTKHSIRYNPNVRRHALGETPVCRSKIVRKKAAS